MGGIDVAFRSRATDEVGQRNPRQRTDPTLYANRPSATTPLGLLSHGVRRPSCRLLSSNTQGSG